MLRINLTERETELTLYIYWHNINYITIESPFSTLDKDSCIVYMNGQSIKVKESWDDITDKISSAHHSLIRIERKYRTGWS